MAYQNEMIGFLIPGLVIVPIVEIMEIGHVKSKGIKSQFDTGAILL